MKHIFFVLIAVCVMAVLSPRVSAQTAGACPPGLVDVGCGCGIPPDAGCGCGIPQAACAGAGGGPVSMPQLPLPSLASAALTLNLEDRSFNNTWSYSNVRQASRASQQNCRTRKKCKTFTTVGNVPLGVAISVDNRVAESSMGVTAQEAVDEAQRKCEAKSRTDCEVIILMDGQSPARYFYWGALVYDPQTRAAGRIWRHGSRQDVEQAARERCGADCMVFPFQDNYAYLGMGRNSQLFFLVGANRASVTALAADECRRLQGDDACTELAAGESDREY